MNDKNFIDTNIIVYAYSQDEPNKQLITRNLLRNTHSVVSTQVLGEFSNVLRKKFSCEYHKISITIAQIVSVCQVVTITPDNIIKALELADRYGYHFYDSLILATALSENCIRVYSEDLQHNQLIESTLTIKNPFIKD